MKEVLGGRRRFYVLCDEALKRTSRPWVEYLRHESRHRRRALLLTNREENLGVLCRMVTRRRLRSNMTIFAENVVELAKWLYGAIYIFKRILAYGFDVGGKRYFYGNATGLTPKAGFAF